MAKFTMDTTAITKAAEELSSVSKDYYSLADEMYKKLVNVQKAGTWDSDKVTGSVNTFIESVSRDRVSAMALATSISNLSSYVSRYASTINNCSDDVI